jgi:hypothetical protein
VVTIVGPRLRWPRLPSGIAEAMRWIDLTIRGIPAWGR